MSGTCVRALLMLGCAASVLLCLLLRPRPRAIGTTWKSKPTRGNIMRYRSPVRWNISRFTYATYVLVLSSRGREGILGLSEGAYWDGVLEEPLSTAIVVAKLVVQETSSPAIGKSWLSLTLS